MINKSDLPKFNPDVYTKITLNDLVVYSIYYLHNKNAEVTSEDVISACFMLFPKRFSLRKHPHWPDSAMVSRHWGVCRSKGYIAAGTDPGFKLTAKGGRLAQKIAKILGMAIPKQEAKVQPSRPKVRAVTPARKVQSEVSEDKTTKPAAVKKARHPQSKKHVVTSTKKVRIAQKGKAISSASAKKKQSPRSKVRAVTQAKEVQPVQKEKVVLQPAVRKTRPPRSKVRLATHLKTSQPVPTKKIIPSKSVRRVQRVQPTELRPTAPIKNVRLIWTEKRKPPEPVVRSDKIEKPQFTQPEKAIHPAQSNVTREVKIRAGKFVRAMETSDAYIHYRKNGKSSKITEFDFRSMLLCTMESSPETLARNVEQFKGYAGIHNRQDLVVFLNFCADKLSYLLIPQTKRSTKPTRRTMK
jgi:hypothetical protein